MKDNCEREPMLLMSDLLDKPKRRSRKASSHRANTAQCPWDDSDIDDAISDLSDMAMGVGHILWASHGVLRDDDFRAAVLTLGTLLRRAADRVEVFRHSNAPVLSDSVSAESVSYVLRRLLQKQASRKKGKS